MRTFSLLVACLSSMSCGSSEQIWRQGERASHLSAKHLQLKRILLALSPTVIQRTKLAQQGLQLDSSSRARYDSALLRAPVMSLGRNRDTSLADVVQTDTSRRGTLFGLLSGLFVPQVHAMTPAETANVGQCLITKAPLALGRCITDPTCLANLACIQTCTGKPDEGECQIKCGDEFTNDVVGAFTKAAVSDTKCVPQRPDDNSWPVPESSALVQTLNVEDLVGDWYIAAGLNPAFDCFDCQFHKFTSPGPGKLKGDLQWRIKDPVAGTNFVTRATVQEFIQDEKEPGILYNHDNEFLHYEDDWYFLAHKPGVYWMVYYRGNNDAWDGYGGAVVYTKEKTLDPKYYGELDEALKKIGRRWSDFRINDNTCKPRESKLEELEADIVFVESRAGAGLQMISEEIGKDVVAVEQEVVKDVVAVEQEVVKDVVAVEREVVKDATVVEKEIEKDIFSIFKR